jgi:hypothetical protein
MRWLPKGRQMAEIAQKSAIRAPALNGKETHILDILVHNPDGMFAPSIAARSWGHVGMWTIYHRIATLQDLGLVEGVEQASPAFGLPRTKYRATSAGVSAFGYCMDSVGSFA